MPPSTNTKKQALSRWLTEHHPARIGVPQLVEIQQALAPISESYLRSLLRECGVPLTPMVEGVRQGTLEELEASLLALLQEYQRSDRIRQVAVRRLVITAKEHAQLAISKKSAPVRDAAHKAEAILWITTWLENPPLFPEWVKLRRAAQS